MVIEKISVTMSIKIQRVRYVNYFYMVDILSLKMFELIQTSRICDA